MHYGSPLFGYSLAFTLIAVTGALRLSLFKRSTPAGRFCSSIRPSRQHRFWRVGPRNHWRRCRGRLSVTVFPQRAGASSWIALSVLGPLLATGFAHLRLSGISITPSGANWLVSNSSAIMRATGFFFSVTRATSATPTCAPASSWDGRTTNSRTAHRNPRAGIGSGRPGGNLLEAARSGGAQPVELTFERRDKTSALIELGCTGVRIGEEHVFHAAAPRRSDEQESASKRS